MFTLEISIEYNVQVTYKIVRALVILCILFDNLHKTMTFLFKSVLGRLSRQATAVSCTSRWKSSLGSATFTELPETHQMLRDTCRQFAEGELWPIAGKIDKTCEYPREQVLKMGELGLMSIDQDEALGGSGLDTLAYAVALEEISR